MKNKRKRGICRKSISNTSKITAFQFVKMTEKFYYSFLSYIKVYKIFKKSTLLLKKNLENSLKIEILLAYFLLYIVFLNQIFFFLDKIRFPFKISLNEDGFFATNSNFNRHFIKKYQSLLFPMLKITVRKDYIFQIKI